MRETRSFYRTPHDHSAQTLPRCTAWNTRVVSSRIHGAVHASAPPGPLGLPRVVLFCGGTGWQNSGPTKQRRGSEDNETHVDYQASQEAKHEAIKQREADRQAAASASRLARLKRQRQTSGEGAGTDQKRNRRMFGLLNSALKAGGAKTERGKIAEARQKEVAENRIKVCVAGQAVRSEQGTSVPSSRCVVSALTS